jgi:hypothetical protein
MLVAWMEGASGPSDDAHDGDEGDPRLEAHRPEEPGAARVEGQQAAGREGVEHATGGVEGEARDA